MRHSISRGFQVLTTAVAVCCLSALFIGSIARAAEPEPIQLIESRGQAPGRIHVRVGDIEIATYVYDDPRTPRPYFTALKTPAGTPLTRNHPPQGGDRDDHPLMHPGLWMAFGDLGGADSWRLKARVEHVEFVARPSKNAFAVRNRYLAADGKTSLCTETVRYHFLSRPTGILLVWDSTFEAGDKPFRLGEQEEMGLGVRMATPIAVSTGRGGRLIDSEGRRNEKAIWGHVASWCDYAGPSEKGWAGITLMAAPGNLPKTWWHVRDYGVFVANSFGPRSGQPASWEIPAGGNLRLRYGVFLHESGQERETDLSAEFMAFEEAVARSDRPPEPATAQ